MFCIFFLSSCSLFIYKAAFWKICNERIINLYRIYLRVIWCAVWKFQFLTKVASALKYLHSKMIIYRDLKSENVLVWSLVKPHDESGRKVPINVKLADYGVSRVVLPTGTKGFAGTPPFMAPEIILHNGEETYTEKVRNSSYSKHWKFPIT